MSSPENKSSEYLLIHEILEEEFTGFHRPVAGHKTIPATEEIFRRELAAYLRKKRTIIRTLFEPFDDQYDFGLNGEEPPRNSGEKMAWLKTHQSAKLTKQLWPELLALLHHQKHAALCLSGGGIRSATFALGVIQGLAEGELLDQFHYLSTVSGGGYVGSWLTAWIHRQGLNNVQQQLAEAARLSGSTPVKSSDEHHDRTTASGSDQTSARPAESDEVDNTPLNVEPPPIRHLRRYSNYLTPQLGLFSADTWTLVATFLRNLVIMWLMMLPLLATILLLPWMALDTLQNPSVRQLVGDHPTWCWGLGCLCLFAAIAYIGVHRPSAGNRRATEGSFFAWCLVPFGLASILLTLFARIGYQNGVPDFTWSRYVILGALVNTLGWVVHLLSFGFWKQQCAAWAKACQPGDQNTLAGFLMSLRFRQILLNKGRELLAVIFIGALAGAIFWRATNLMFGGEGQPRLIDERWYICFSSPLLLLMMLGTETLFVAVASMVTRDEDREWWARAGAWVLLIIVSWIALSVLVLLSPDWLTMFRAKASATIATIGGFSGLITLLLGYSAKTVGHQDPDGGRQKEQNPLSELALKFAAPIFVVCVLTLAAAGIWKLREIILAWLVSEHQSLLRWLENQGAFFYAPRLAMTVTLMAVCLLLAVLMSFFVNLNKFSLHALYRNRLIRAYLGASRIDCPPGQCRNDRITADAQVDCRCPHPFTGFDPSDNLEMWKLWPRRADLWQGEASDQTATGISREQQVNADIAQKHQSRLFHVVNTALNLVSGNELAWQERKAASFTFTPLHSGSLVTGYRHSRWYSAVKTLSGRKEAIKLGTAVTISGAAASPNMGYSSSPAITFLMTLFNVRLGWWLGNPGKAGDRVWWLPGLIERVVKLRAERPWQKSGPTLAIQPLISEALGLTNQNKPWINLSDGGHFENLGLYEMVLRRCHYIVLSDAGCDPDHNFDDLGMAIRKIRIDMGIPIEFIGGVKIQSRRQWKEAGNDPNYHFAYARIRYRAIDTCPGAEDGHLIYLKPALSGDEPQDVLNYASGDPAFPHDSTLGDQFFSESQFESYRMLGLHSIRTVKTGAPTAEDQTSHEAGQILGGFFKSVRALVRDRAK